MPVVEICVHELLAIYSFPDALGLLLIGATQRGPNIVLLRLWNLRDNSTIRRSWPQGSPILSPGPTLAEAPSIEE